MLERARSYRALCERALDKRPAYKPKGFDEMLHYGVYLHNRGEFEEALKFLRQAAEMHPQNEHVALLPGRHRGARGRHGRRAHGAAPGRDRRPRTTAPRPGATPTSTIREEDEFSASSTRRRS